MVAVVVMELPMAREKLMILMLTITNIIMTVVLVVINVYCNYGLVLSGTPCSEFYSKQ